MTTSNTSAGLIPASAPRPGGSGLKPTRVSDETGNPVQPGPYIVEASCDLSEDYFLTSEVLLALQAGDTVLPFLNTTSGATEAIVLCGGTLSHLRRNPSVASGWSYKVIDAVPFAGITSAAVVSSSTHNAMIMAAGPRSTNPKDPLALCQLALEADGATWTCPSNGWFDWQLAGPIGGAATGDGDIYWYGWTQNANTATKNWDYAFYRWDGMGDNAGVDGVSLVTTLSYPLSTSTSPVAARLHLDAKIGGFPYSFAVVMLNSIESPANGYAIQSYRIIDGTATTIEPSAGGGRSLLWSYVSPDSSVPAPAVLWQDTQNNLHFVDETGAQANLYNSAGGVGDGQIATWELDGEYTFAILDESKANKGTVDVVSQFGSGGDSGFTLPIPLITGISSIYGLPTDPAEATLFAVDLDDGLSVLTKSAAGGWSQNVVHQDAATSQEVTSWRCQITMSDTNQCGVSQGSVQLSTDQPVALWQDSGSTVVTPATPAVVACDVRGKVTVSIPAAELDSALLTAQPLDASGNPYGSPLDIVPNTDVHSFLAGTGSLASVGGNLSGHALTTAQNKTWVTASQSYVASGALLPKLANAQSASDVATAINHVMSLPANVPAASGVQSALLDFTGSASLQTSSDPHAYDSQKTGETSWWDKARQDIDSAFHGLRHGAISVKKMITGWDQDAKQWTVNLIIDIGDDLDHLMDYVVTTAEDAIHAISSFVHALGADIEHFCHWLKNLVLGVIRDADATAELLQGWFDSLSTAGIAVLDHLESLTDKFFEAQEARVTAQIGIWKDDVDAILFGSVAATPAPATDTGGDDSSSAFTAAEDFFKFLQHSPASWLWNKIMSHVQPMSTDSIKMDMSVFANLPTDLSGIVNSATATTTHLGQTLLDATKTFTSATGFKEANIGALFDDLGNLADDVLVLLDKIADTVLDLMKDFLQGLHNLLTSEFELPFIGEILDLAGVDSTPSIGRVTSLIIAYPAALLHNLWVGEGPMFNFGDDSQTRSDDGLVGRGAADKNGFGLDLAAGVVQFIWTEVDVAIDILAFKSEINVVNPPSSKLTQTLSILDFTLPIAMTALQWPSPWNATTTPIPCENWDFTDPTAWGEYNYFIPGIITTTVAPWLFQGLGWVWGQFDDDEGPSGDFNDYVLPWLQCAFACANNVFGAWWQYANSNASKTDQANAVLDWTIPNLSYVDCPLAYPPFVKSSDGVTSVIKFCIDAVANYGATAFCFQQAVAAKNG
jgi:hypothetical protein